MHAVRLRFVLLQRENARLTDAEIAKVAGADAPEPDASSKKPSPLRKAAPAQAKYAHALSPLLAHVICTDWR